MYLEVDDLLSDEENPSTADDGEVAVSISSEKETQTDIIIYPTPMVGPQHGKLLFTRGTQTELFAQAIKCDQATQFEIMDMMSPHKDDLTNIHSYNIPSGSTYTSDLEKNPPPSTSKPKFTSTPASKSKQNPDRPYLDFSFDSVEDKEASDKKDITYEPDSEDEGSDTDDTFCEEVGDICSGQVEPHEQKKYLVFQSNIIQLFQRCQLCGDLITNILQSTVGTLLKITTTCTAGHDFTWFSQPLIRRMPAGNLLASAALLFTGCSYTQISTFAEILKMQFFNSSTYNRIQSDLFKVVNEAWLNEKNRVSRDTENKTLWLAGDGRCDSPGFSAKYGTYTLLDQVTGKIVDFEIVHVSEVGNKSTNMEKEGLIRSLTRVTNKNNVAVLATDRHVQVAKALRTAFPQILHQFDVWHVSKSISKKLTEKSKMKGCEDLKLWIQAISNHFWWSVYSCDGNAEILKEKWISVLHHCANVHQWSSCNSFHSCDHPPIQPEVARTKPWLKRSSRAHEQLKLVVLNKYILKCLEQLTLFCHTGELEVYHSMMLKYCPKKLHFSYEGMLARTQLAALDHNCGTQREQAIAKTGENTGELMYKQVFPKCSKHWVVKPVYQSKSYNFRANLMARTVLVKEEKIDLPAIAKPDLSPNIATAPKPGREEAIASHRSRMTSAHKDVSN